MATMFNVLAEKTLYGGQRFCVVQADIREVEANAYICPSDENFGLGGRVAASLLQKTGNQLTQAVKTEFRGQKLPFCKAKLFTCDWLPLANSVIFVNGPRWDASKANDCSMELRDTVQAALLEADRNNLHSVAVPLVGGGNANFPKETAAQTLVTAIKFYLNEPMVYLDTINKAESSIQVVYFILFEKAAVDAFKESLEAMPI